MAPVEGSPATTSDCAAARESFTARTVIEPGDSPATSGAPAACRPPSATARLRDPPPRAAPSPPSDRPCVSGPRAPFVGHAALFTPRRGLRYADLYPDRAALCSAPRRTLGVLGSVPAAIGAIEATEALKLLAGMEPSLDGRLFVLDLKNMQCETIAL